MRTQRKVVLLKLKETPPSVFHFLLQLEFSLATDLRTWTLPVFIIQRNFLKCRVQVSKCPHGAKPLKGASRNHKFPFEFGVFCKNSLLIKRFFLLDIFGRVFFEFYDKLSKLFFLLIVPLLCLWLLRVIFFKFEERKKPPETFWTWCEVKSLTYSIDKKFPIFLYFLRHAWAAVKSFTKRFESTQNLYTETAL